MFFPVRSREDVMQEQIILSKTVDGLSPNITDDMPYSEYIDWLQQASDYLEQMKKESNG